jgi:hypothetical protein
MWRCVVLVWTKFSEESMTSIIRVGWLQPFAHADSSLADFLYHEDGGDTFLRNVGSYKNYTAPHPRKRYSSNWLCWRGPAAIYLTDPSVKLGEKSDKPWSLYPVLWSLAEYAAKACYAILHISSALVFTYWRYEPTCCCRNKFSDSDRRFSRQQILRLRPIWTWHRVIWYICTDVAEEAAAFISYFEVGASRSLRNIGISLPYCKDYKAAWLP